MYSPKRQLNDPPPSCLSIVMQQTHFSLLLGFRLGLRNHLIKKRKWEKCTTALCTHTEGLLLCCLTLTINLMSGKKSAFPASLKRLDVKRHWVTMLLTLAHSAYTSTRCWDAQGHPRRAVHIQEQHNSI